MTAGKRKELDAAPAATEAPEGLAIDTGGFRRFARTAIQGSVEAALVALAGLLGYVPGLRSLGS